MKTRGARVVVGIAVSASLFFVPPAMAQVSPKGAAEALFENGKELLARGDVSTACAKLDASQKLDPAVGTLLYLGDCYERIDKTASAWAAFREAASMAEASGQRPRFEIATTRANALEPKLSFVTIHVPDDHRVAGLVITLAGLDVPQASWEVRLPADPGETRVTASAPGFATWASTIVVADSADQQDIDVPRLRERPTVDGPPPARPRASEEAFRSTESGLGPQRIAGIVIGSVGLAGLTAGGAFGLQALLDNDESLDSCRPNDPTLCSAHGVELRDRAETFATASTVALIAGGALAATGLVVVLTAPGKEPRAGQARAPTVALGPGGLRLGGVW